MRTSADGISLLRRNEGCRLTAYLDTIANPPVFTIGYGCTGAGIHEGLTITQVQADQMLADRLAREFEPGVTDALGNAPVTQPQFDALVSLAFNIGVGALAKSSVIRDHRGGDYQAAADAFRMWNKAGHKVISGLVRRREEERALYMSGTIEPASDIDIDIDLVADLVRALQRVVGVDPDGKMGPKTVAAIEQAQRLPK